MILKIQNKKSFVNNFLTAIEKINNSCILSITQKGFSSLLNSQDQTIILYSVFDHPNEIEGLKLNLPDLNRLIKILNCIESDEIELKIETNSIKYTSKDIRFTYHLLHDGIIPNCQLNPEKIKTIDYQTSFTITPETLVNIVRGSTLTSDNTAKIYFSTDNGEVFGELTDKQRDNVDSYKMKIAESYKGEAIKEELPLTYEVLRNIASCRCPNGVNVLINHEKSVITFDVSAENVKSLYIASGLTG